MKNQFFKSLAIFAFLAGILLSCTPTVPEEKHPDPAFMKYIRAYTGGTVSSSSSIEIHFDPGIVSKINSTADPSSLFHFKPNIKGEASWQEDYLLVFHPAEPLQNGQRYEVTFDLGKLVDTPDPMRKFNFTFDVVRQSFTVEVSGIYSDYEDYNLVAIKGKIMLADVAAPDQVEQLLSASIDNHPLKLTWEHLGLERVSQFTIDSIKRADEDKVATFKWNGDPFGIDEQGQTRVSIPSTKKFEVTQTKVSQQPQQMVTILFSDPLSDKQPLEGLISLDANCEIKYTLDKNELKVYPQANLQGQKILHIDGNLKSIFGRTLGSNQEIVISFDAVYPAIKFTASGNILPQSEQLVIPFQAVNLNAVDVKIIRIYEDNIPQFFQQNNLDDSRGLNRVGRPVLSKKLELKAEKPVDYGQWNTFFLDLGKLIRVEPGAIYHVNLSFQKAYSAYPCDDPSGGEITADDDYEDYYYDDRMDHFDWDKDGYYYENYYPRGYRWRERDNPCHISYYYGERFISKNVFASNLGLMAKAGEDGKYFVTVTNLLNTAPVNGAKLKMLNYQQRPMAEARTNDKGMAEIELDGKPFLLVAEYQGQKAYLKLDDGSSLSLSKFDVEGEAVKEGLKGFIYGERGVWRPGDTLFLTFILQDQHKTLPPGHPVIFELIDPSNRVVRKIVRNNGTNGFYDFITTTDPDARTGNYQARVSVGNVVFHKNIRIETIKPNRLKINLDFDRSTLESNGSTTPATLTARWLHGGTASQLKATISQLFSKKQMSFPEYKGYIFEDPSKNLNATEKVIFDGKLDNKGKSTVMVNTAGNFNAPGMLTTSFMVKVFEPSGEFSIDRVSIPYAPYPQFVGMKLNGTDKWGFLVSDSTYQCEVVTIDAEGKVTASGKLEVAIYRVDWNWWWNSDGNDLASYFSSSYRAPVLNKTISLEDGKGTFKFKTEKMDWGRYYIRITDPEGGHSAGLKFYVTNSRWWRGPGEAGREFATMLDFESSKEKYNVGETATIRFPAGKTGRALVSIENGSCILKTDWVDLTADRMEYSFKVTEDMTPNVYAYVCLLQPHAQVLNDLPIRLYGVIPILVEDPGTKIEPEIIAPDKIRPKENYTIKVKERNGKPMTYTLAVVDEGLLDLTHFKTPDAWNYFFAREALGVKTWDMFDQVVGAFGGKLERVLAIGGDGSEEPGNKARVNRFKPVVQFIGPVTLDARGENTHELTMPNYVGSVRVMVVAASENPAYGLAEKAVPVKQPVMVLATLPRVLAPGEKVKLPVNVFMMEDKSHEVIVSVKTNSFLQIEGPVEKTVTFKKAGEELVEFDLNVSSAIGEGSVTVKATMGKEEAEYHFDIEVRNPNPPVIDYYFTRLEGHDSWMRDLDLPGVQGTNSMRMEVSSSLPLNLAGHLDYLLSYPYGCSEQTTSKAFPQLYLADLIQLTPDQQMEATRHVQATIERLRNFQGPNGGFGFWPENYRGDDYVSSYVGHFLTEAKMKGYNVPETMYKNWLIYQRSASVRWELESWNSLVQAYRLYTLALAGDPQLGQMNRLREQKQLTNPAICCLASAYALAGQKEAARNVMERFAFADTNGDDYYYYFYGSPLRNMAMKLEALIYLDEEEEAAKLAFDISREFSKKAYFSTQTTAYVLRVMSKFSSKNVSDESLKYTLSFDKAPGMTVTTPYHISFKEWDKPDTLGDRMTITNEGSANIFIRMSMKGRPLTDTLPSRDKNLKVRAEYKDMNGNAIDPQNLPQGMDFKVDISVTLSSISWRQDNLALSFIVPSGWEILRRSASGFEADYSGPSFDYQDIRDDRVYTFFDLSPGQTKTFTVFLNATYKGKFFMPAVSCEAMYDDAVFSRQAGRWVNVFSPED